MRLIKQFARRALSALGYTAVDTTWMGEALTHVNNAASTLERELLETKSGVSALQGESGQTLSHIMVMRQELAQLLRRVQAQAPAESESLREVSPTPVPSVLLSEILRLPRQLERKATSLSANRQPADMLANARSLAEYYLDMADLAARHWIISRTMPSDPYPADDLTFAYAKRIQALVPAEEVESETLPRPVPWRYLWSDPRCGIFLVLGNGTAANSGEIRYACDREVYSFDFMRVRCSQASDPLPGASGNGGSIWSRLGDQLIGRGLLERVLFVPLAFAGSKVADWIPGGSRHRRTALALSRLRKELASPMLPFCAVLWHPGEASALSPSAYRLHCHDIISDMRANGVFAPVFIARANENRTGTRQEKQIIQGDAAVGIFAGPNIDAIGSSTRERTHLNLDRAASLWLDVLSAHWSLLYSDDD